MDKLLGAILWIALIFVFCRAVLGMAEQQSNDSSRYAQEYQELEQTTHSAKEIGEKLGISANKVGRLANEHNLKTDKFGRYVLDKSQSSEKQVESFRYFDCVIPVMQALLTKQ